MDVNASNNIDSADEDERRALFDPGAPRQAEKAEKKYENQRKVVTRSRRLLKGPTLQNS